MGYRFEADEDVEAGLARIATEQVAKAREDLAREGSAEAVHELRKRMKKLRGLVRLVRPAFERYAEENALFRATAERLAPQA